MPCVETTRLPLLRGLSQRASESERARAESAESPFAGEQNAEEATVSLGLIGGRRVESFQNHGVGGRQEHGFGVLGLFLPS